jgi:hypothetical protein
MYGDLSRDDLLRLTQAALRLLDAWGLTKEDQLRILGLPPDMPRRIINRCRLGTPLPNEGDCYARLLLLLQIDSTLKKLFPHSELAANLWATTQSLSFGGEAPLATMLRDGLEGIRLVEQVVSGPLLW